MPGELFAGRFRSELERGLSCLGLEAVGPFVPALVTLAELVVEWNERAGLVAAADAVEMAGKHFLDSLLCLLSSGWQSGGEVVDVGSGAGFPGMVLAVVEPGRRVSLVEAHGRKCAFLRHAAATLGVAVTVVQERAEEYGRCPDGPGRERFHIGLARAVAPLGLSCELVLPLIATGGSYVAQVGPGQGRALERHLAAFQDPSHPEPAWRTLGADLTDLLRTCLPGGAGERWLARFTKTGAGPGGYPRRPAASRRKPLWVPGG